MKKKSIAQQMVDIITQEHVRTATGYIEDIGLVQNKMRENVSHVENISEEGHSTITVLLKYTDDSAIIVQNWEQMMAPIKFIIV